MSKEVRDQLRLISDVEQHWVGAEREPVTSPFQGWMPYQIADFTSIMVECAMYAEGSKFLDVGSGPGTKMAVANLLFGFEVHGIENNFKMALTAASLNTEGTICIGDALHWDDGTYGDYDVIWLYRLFRNAELEQKLEERIRAEMKPGAILAGGAWELEPPPGWGTIVDDWEVRKGAWKKP